jgi:hypothetical protein
MMSDRPGREQGIQVSRCSCGRVVNNPDWPKGEGEHLRWDDDEGGDVELNRYEVNLRLRAETLTVQEWVELGEMLRGYGAPVVTPDVAAVARAGREGVVFPFEIEAEDLWDAHGLVYETMGVVNNYFASEVLTVEGKPTERGNDNHSRKVRHVK